MTDDLNYKLNYIFLIIIKQYCLIKRTIFLYYQDFIMLMKTLHRRQYKSFEIFVLSVVVHIYLNIVLELYCHIITTLHR